MNSARIVLFLNLDLTLETGRWSLTHDGTSRRAGNPAAR